MNNTSQRALRATILTRQRAAEAVGTASNGGPRILAWLETATKAAAIPLGVLYVVGLLIINQDLARLGTADFSLIQGQAVAAGLLFTVFLVLLSFAMLPAGVAVVIVWKLRRERLAWLALPLAALLTTVILILILIFFSFAFAWAPTIADAYQLDRPFSVSGPATRFHEAVHYYSLLVPVAEILFRGPFLAFMATALLAAVEIAAIVLPRLMPTLMPRDGTDRPAGGAGGGLVAWRTEDKSLLVFLALLFGFTALTLVPSYVSSIYPNLFRGIGGGQPSVVKIRLAPPPMSPPGQPSSSQAPLIDSKEDFVLWYETSKFIYIESVASPSRISKMIALGASKVDALEYQQKAVRVSRSGKVEVVPRQE